MHELFIGMSIDYRSLEIEDLIELGLGSGESLGEFFHARTYSLEGFFSSHYARTQRSGLTGNRLVAKVLRRMLGFGWRGIVSSNSSTRKSISSRLRNSGITQKPRSSSEEEIALKSVMSIPF